MLFSSFQTNKGLLLEGAERLRRDPGPAVLDAVSHRRGELKRLPTTCRLVQEGKAYPCFCTDEEVAQMKAQAEAESRPPVYTGRWAHASTEDVEQEKEKVRAAGPA